MKLLPLISIQIDCANKHLHYILTDVDQAEQSMVTESLEFKIILSTITILATLVVVIILIIRKSKCHRTISKRYNCCCTIEEDKTATKQTKWSIMLDKRPLPKLPPEGKTRCNHQQSDHQESSQKQTENINGSVTGTGGGLVRNKTLQVEQLDGTSRKSYKVTTPPTKKSSNNNKTNSSSSANNIDEESNNSRKVSTAVSDNGIISPPLSPVSSPTSRRIQRKITMSESSTGDYAQYNYNTGIAVRIEDDHRDNHYDALESNAYAYAKYGPDYAYADMQNQNGYVTAAESYETLNGGYDDTAKQGVYETFPTKQGTDAEDGDNSKTDLYQTLNHNYEIDYDDGYQGNGVL